MAQRIVNLMPKLANAKMRRTWRGLYPMSPDGFPIVERAREPEGCLRRGDVRAGVHVGAGRGGAADSYGAG
jgi:sarcosine oxidase subunit beta